MYIVTEPFKQLLPKYVAANPNHLDSWRAFFALKPFYVWGTTMQVIEMCCCKLHLLAIWVISALLTTWKQQKIDLGEVSDYNSFFNFITAECESESNTCKMQDQW